MTAAEPGKGSGGVAEYLSRPSVRGDRLRTKCRTVVEILQFRQANGEPVVLEDEARALIRAAIPLAGQAVKSGSARNYRAIMSVLGMLARLEQCDKPVEHAHAHLHLDARQRAEAIEQWLRAEAAERGLDVSTVKLDGVDDGQSESEDGGNGREREE